MGRTNNGGRKLVVSARIVAEGLGKRYTIGPTGGRHRNRTLREDLMQAAAVPWRAVTGQGRRAAETEGSEIWAVRDLSFEVADGEVFGIIGRNGAGKSTLLKLLSRIVMPTTGRATIRGRVGTLLEVGAGFHAELTGRDNVYLSGSVLGMTRTEIDRKFDEIVDFSGVERFLDTPVKRYSTGMYLRLAFAVAAHLEAAILIVDEVLAVGDAEFQKKCLGRMHQVATEGRTVLFVSHSLAAIRSLCHRACVLEAGQIVRQGDVHECIKYYLQWDTQQSAATVSLVSAKGTSPRMISATLLSDGQPTTRALTGSDIGIRVCFESDAPLRVPRIGFGIVNDEGDRLLDGNNRYQTSPMYDFPVSKGTVLCDLGTVPLMPGRYAVSLFLGDAPGHDSHVVEHALWFEVIERDLWGTGQVPDRTAALMWWPTAFRFSE